MSILNLKNLVSGQAIKGAVFIESYTIEAFGKPPKPYIKGVFNLKGVTTAFTIWDDGLVNLFKNNDFSGQIFDISGATKEYKGAVTVTVNTVEQCKEPYDLSMFKKSADVQTIFNDFKSFLKTDLPAECSAMIIKIFTQSNLLQAFSTEYAGKKMHDAQIGGLLNHTVKMLHYAKLAVSLDNRLESYKEILYTGIIFHDIGKTMEMNQGVYTDFSYITHRGFGIELLSTYKKDIIDTMGDIFYYKLISIVLGHHGQYEDRPRTIEAMIVHLIDMLDSGLTGILDKIENGDVKEENTGNKFIYHGDFQLFL